MDSIAVLLIKLGHYHFAALRAVLVVDLHVIFPFVDVQNELGGEELLAILALVMIIPLI